MVYGSLPRNPYANPVVYTDSPLASGYLHPFKCGRAEKLEE